jgi:elongation factor 3
MDSLFEKLSSSVVQERSDAAQNILSSALTSDSKAILSIVDKLNTFLADQKLASRREGALVAIGSLCSAGTTFEPYLVDFIPNLLERAADKVASIRTAAQEVGCSIISLLNPNGVKIVLPMLFEGMGNKKKWEVKFTSLALLDSLVKSAPKQLGLCLPDIIPIVSQCMWDTKPQVKKAGTSTMLAVCTLVGNRDLERFVPAVVSCISTPSEVPECIHMLGATTFVQTVEPPTLAIMVPLLVRALNERATPIKRKAAVIIDNMCKLVDNPADMILFMPFLEPALKKTMENMADPEARNVCEKAYSTLVKAAGGQVVSESAPKPTADPALVLSYFQSIVTASEDQVKIVNYVVALSCALINSGCFEIEEWIPSFVPYVKSFVDQSVAEAACKTFMDKCFQQSRSRDTSDQEDNEGEDLCNCEFSLAYGGKILLNNATLWLKRGRRYGLCGPNGAGKSTLMKAIANGQLDGFPSPDVLKTVYVEHDIDGCEAEQSVVDFVTSDAKIVVDKEEIVATLSSVGFTEYMQNSSVHSLSGGWKMKLALARAMLMHADIFLLDEPTNHLDVVNVKWLENYLNGLTNVTCMLVSHDSGFLDNVCTDIIHYEMLKLKRYRGNLSEFVKKVPEAQSYYDLAATQIAFKFPEPGFLEGVKSKGKAILKMASCAYTYPGKEVPTLRDVSVQCSLSSRVAVIGPNGAGKSTMIKLLTSEMEPTAGTVWKHPNLRIAYVAQHAFHHLEKHLNSTPNEYIQWRYAGGEDREELEKVDRTANAEEEKQMAQLIVHDGVKKVVEKIVGRRKLKQSYEYEVQWVGLHPDKNSWLSRNELENLGFIKLVNEMDAQKSAEAGLVNRPLTTGAVEKHLGDVGLEAEFATHSQIKGLSGGQKVKVVIAAAMWNNPHLLVLDEPTNYLDRESLGALAMAIKTFGGGVIMISHNSSFTKHICSETWAMDDGELIPSGHDWTAGNKGEKLVEKDQEEQFDAYGNLIKVKVVKKLTGKDLRKQKKEKAARKKRGEASDDEDDF